MGDCTRLKAWPKSVRPEDQDAADTQVAASAEADAPKSAKKAKAGRKAAE